MVSYGKEDNRQGHDAWRDHKLCAVSAAAGRGKCCTETDSSDTNLGQPGWLELQVPVVHWVLQFLSMKLSAVSPELNCDLDLQDVSWTLKNKQLTYVALLAHWSLCSSLPCRSFARKTLAPRSRDTARDWATFILVCTGHLSQASHVQNYMGMGGWSRIQQMFIWRERLRCLHFPRFASNTHTWTNTCTD